MKITSLKNKDGSKLSGDQYFSLMTELEHAIKDAGFVTDISKQDAAIHLSNSKFSLFTIDLKKLPYNARIGRAQDHSIKGYVRTSVPTWNQRVQFNNILNMVLDKHEISANIRSGIFAIRRGFIVYNEDDWLNAEYCAYNGWINLGMQLSRYDDSLAGVMTELEAIEYKNSPLRLAKHKASKKKLGRIILNKGESL